MQFLPLFMSNLGTILATISKGSLNSRKKLWKRENFSIANKSKQLGFHYYDDTDHYDEVRFDYWLPKLQLLPGTSLVSTFGF